MKSHKKQKIQITKKETDNKVLSDEALEKVSGGRGARQGTVYNVQKAMVNMGRGRKG